MPSTDDIVIINGLCYFFIIIAVRLMGRMDHG